MSVMLSNAKESKDQYDSVCSKVTNTIKEFSSKTHASENQRSQGIIQRIRDHTGYLVSIYIKVVVGVRRFPADAEELDEVVELAVDVTTHSDGATHGLYVPLLDEDRLCLLA